jgi:H+-transporting ATPase
LVTKSEFKDMPIDKAFAELDSSPEGLGEAEAERRLEDVGPNAITEKGHSKVISFLRKLVHPFTLMIEIAIIISIVLKDWPDVVLISFLLVLNVSVDFVQERKAENVLESLRNRMAVRARVWRDGEWKTVNAAALVPGDVILLDGGDIVPADAKLIEGAPIELDESTLTGESLPVEKGPSDIVFSSSVVNKGEMQALVVQTGDRTFFGRTASLAEEKPEASHFEKAINNVGKYVVGLAFVSMAAIIVISSVVRHEAFGQILLLALTLAVASIPAALPAILTVTMTVGATHLAHEDVLVRRLAAIEELASADIICSDKTGTLTTGHLEMDEPILYSDVSRDEAMDMAILCSNYPATEDPIDKAVVEGSKRLGFDIDRASAWRKVEYTPADSTSKRASTVIEKEGGKRRIIKGAPQVVLEASRVDDELTKTYRDDVERLAETGYRALGVAYLDEPADDEDKGMTLVAVLPLHDPPRQDTADTIKAAHDLGIDVKMITGDHAAAAKEIASEIGLGADLASADEMTSWSDDEFAARAEQYDIFAQVLPENKYRIVKALQEDGHIVGMTGDGVNDSPALHRADVGIAVEGANDVARGSADVILTRPGLKVIINGVREGKMVFSRMKNYVIYRISETYRIIFFITLTVLIFNLKPLGPNQIVLLAIMNDIPILAIAGDRVTEAAGPESWGLKRLVIMGSVLGTVGIFASFLLFFIYNHSYHLHYLQTYGQVQTAMFLKLSIGGHMLFFCARNRRSWWRPPAPSRSLLAAILGTMAISTTISAVGLGSLLPRLPIGFVGLTWVWCLVWMQITDGVKLLTYRVLDKREARKPSEKIAQGPAPIVEKAA